MFSGLKGDGMAWGWAGGRQSSVGWAREVDRVVDRVWLVRGQRGLTIRRSPARRYKGARKPFDNPSLDDSTLDDPEKRYELRSTMYKLRSMAYMCRC
eukprot:4484250-Prymnesium_polylepis.1